jgi:hypothetical protein
LRAFAGFTEFTGVAFTRECGLGLKLSFGDYDNSLELQGPCANALGGGVIAIC